MIAVVTGASSGMGREFFKKLDENENLDEIWVMARRENRLNELRETAKTPVRIIACDLTDEESIKEYALLLEKEKPQIKILVNCSGFGKFGHTDVVSLEDSLDMIDLNCKALVSITQTSLPYMAKNSHIVELCSLSSFQPVPYLNVYASTKAFVLSYSRGLNAELKKRNIHVMAVCPGWVETEFFLRAQTKQKDAVTYFNKVYKAKDVIDTAYKDMYKLKQVSIHGFMIKAQVLLVKLLPHSLVIKIWLKQQKH
ncbi:MAG: SDR family NAD(P)-dependent oxidoreductase [Clostridiales bacterium]|nr:SDR family NAD(P)-dependent oxidoreductase [Clostridiales bacterium]